jgi:hypothetical protein
MRAISKRGSRKHPSRAPKVNPTRLEIFKNIFHSVAEEMGAALRRSAFSPNIKERRDYSCAVYDADGQVLAMGDHMPVHLGSMPASVAAARAAFPLDAGDIALLNDPFRGHASAGSDDGHADIFAEEPACVFLCRQPRAPRRRRRSTRRIDGPRSRDFPGRTAHSAGKTFSSWRNQ